MGSAWSRQAIADLLVARLRPERERLRADYSRHALPHFVIDDLLPQELAESVRGAFPDSSRLMLKNSLRERKYVTSQMNRCDPLLEEIVYAFQDARIVALIGDITGMQPLEPDTQLYAGGVSVMENRHFLNPHIDNSHDKERRRYRVLNLLYYVSPDWKRENGGNFELWPHGPRGEPLTIVSRFNRLVVMATTRRSWHSVSAVRVDDKRTCVSNYYFSANPPDGEEYFHITAFRGRPEQPLRDLVLRGDAWLRSAIRLVAKRGLIKTKHYYRRDLG